MLVLGVQVQAFVSHWRELLPHEQRRLHGAPLSAADLLSDQLHPSGTKSPPAPPNHHNLLPRLVAARNSSAVCCNIQHKSTRRSVPVSDLYARALPEGSWWEPFDVAIGHEEGAGEEGRGREVRRWQGVDAQGFRLCLVCAGRVRGGHVVGWRIPEVRGVGSAGEVDGAALLRSVTPGAGVRGCVEVGKGAGGFHRAGGGGGGEGKVDGGEGV